MRLIDADAITYELWTTEVDVDNKRDNYRYYQNRFMVDRRDIETMPIVEERPKGRWIPVTNGRGGHECSECHAYAPSYQNGDELYSDFCPHCGAYMGGTENEITKNK